MWVEEEPENHRLSIRPWTQHVANGQFFPTAASMTVHRGLTLNWDKLSKYPITSPVAILHCWAVQYSIGHNCQISDHISELIFIDIW